jgi:hypothetical protein
MFSTGEAIYSSKIISGIKGATSVAKIVSVFWGSSSLDSLDVALFLESTLSSLSD